MDRAAGLLSSLAARTAYLHTCTWHSLADSGFSLCTLASSCNVSPPGQTVLLLGPSCSTNQLCLYRCNECHPEKYSSRWNGGNNEASCRIHVQLACAPRMPFLRPICLQNESCTRHASSPQQCLLFGDVMRQLHASALALYLDRGGGASSANIKCIGGTRVLHPLRFFKLEDTAGIIIALVSVLMTPSSILSGGSFLC